MNIQNQQNFKYHQMYYGNCNKKNSMLMSNLVQNDNINNYFFRKQQNNQIINPRCVVQICSSSEMFGFILVYIFESLINFNILLKS